ncbi:hypothetical protein SAMN05216205_4248 [Pseudomonas mohnii]|jgi:hypothetical protein|uniref:Uncharacterized protein n=1 Tax=Pseudomonas mohnii TaxID=395600 RepID=A0ABY0Y816_9PSED|nr:hypothetical protein SAMN05216205_4248 [Pseudomonas mohnii]
MQLGFDRQHFTLPRVGIFLGLNKGWPVVRQTRFDKSWASVEFLFEFVVKGLVTDQFHLVRIIGGTDTRGSHEATRPLDTRFLLMLLSQGERSREFSAGDCRYVAFYKPCLIPK